MPGNAEAGHVHFGGGAHFSGGSHVGGGGGYHASVHWGGGGYYHPHVWGVRGHVWVGGYRPYYYRPYYAYYYPVPSYYGGSYYPVESEPTYAGPSTAVAVAAEPELPRFGIGLIAGGVATTNNTQPTTSAQDDGHLGR